MLAITIIAIFNYLGGNFVFNFSLFFCCFFVFFVYSKFYMKEYIVTTIRLILIAEVVTSSIVENYRLKTQF